VAAREWPRDELDSYDSPAPSGPSTAFSRVSDRLLEKGYSVMGRQLGGKWPAQLDAKRIIGALATSLVAYQHNLPYLTEGVNSKWFGIDESTQTPFIWADCFEKALGACFPPEEDERTIGVSVDYDFWKSFAVASGIISFVPGVTRDCFAFGSRDFMLYFSATELSRAMNDDLQSVLRFIGCLLDSGIRADGDARRLIVMLISSIGDSDRTAFEGIGLTSSIISLIVGCIEGIAITRPIDGADGQLETARGANAIIDDILTETFGSSSLISYCHTEEDALGVNPFERCMRYLTGLFESARRVCTESGPTEL
ncbi:MAG: hypothetical protein IJ087_00670, partial [Eggerthellaceae bacterium]|nr:hypothetical protein [Eggerthellaceae bacterium]